MKPQDIVLIIGLVLIFGILFYWIKRKEQEIEIMEEPNPEYLELIGTSRNNFVNELLEHYRVDFCLPTQDIVKDSSVDLVRENVNRIVTSVENYLITTLIYWGKKIKITVLVLDPLTETSREFRLTLRLRDNSVRWHTLHQFGQKVDTKVFNSLKEEDRFKDLVIAAKEIAATTDKGVIIKFLFDVARAFPFEGQRQSPRVAAKQFAMLMSYILANHTEDYLEYLKEEDE